MTHYGILEGYPSFFNFEIFLKGTVEGVQKPTFPSLPPTAYCLFV
jgi:hypothetical protein